MRSDIKLNKELQERIGKAHVYIHIHQDEGIDNTLGEAIVMAEEVADG